MPRSCAIYRIKASLPESGAEVNVVQVGYDDGFIGAAGNAGSGRISGSSILCPS